jgi:hypothetical protein
MASWAAIFSGSATRVGDFFRKLGGPLSIIMVAGFAIASSVWSGTGTLSWPLRDYSIATNLIWAFIIVFALVAVIFSPRSDASKLWAFVQGWGGLIALALLLIIPFLTGSSSVSAKEASQEHWVRASLVALLILLLIVPIAWQFLDVFTRSLLDQTREQVKGTIHEMVYFCYLFMLIALFVSFVPPVLMGIVYLGQEFVPGETPAPKSDAPPSLTRVFYDAMVDSPVGLVRGCVDAPGEQLWELACRPGTVKKDSSADATKVEGTGDIYAAQWLINIGGSATYAKPTDPGENAQPAAPTQPVGADQKPSPTQSTDAGKVESALPGAVFYQVTIHGGLAVPWYFIMLAIMGAAVSMARRVPEYQRQVLIPNTNGDAKTPSAPEEPDGLSPRMVRELLVFQVLQVLSAPLIAITAYNTMLPSSRATSVALAFVSGFSSESVLLAIRALAEKIQPEMKTTTSSTLRSTSAAATAIATVVGGPPSGTNITLTATSSSLPTSPIIVRYTVQVGDDGTAIAKALAAQVNADATLKTANVSATAKEKTVTLTSPSSLGLKWTATTGIITIATTVVA